MIVWPGFQRSIIALFSVAFEKDTARLPQLSASRIRDPKRPYRFTHENELPFAWSEIHRTLIRLAGAIAFLPRSKGVPGVYVVDMAVEHKMENEGESHISSDNALLSNVRRIYSGSNS
jgi:hypothetical protein